MNKNLTEVVFILDKSGSMSGLEKDVIGGFNSTIAKQKKEKGECLVSTVLFDNHSKVVHDRVPVSEVRNMTDNDFCPGGCTALVDALASSIKYIKKVHKIIREEDRPANTLFIITTDGMENASTRYNSDQLKKMIKEQSEAGWNFIYLASNIDAVETGSNYGFVAEQTVDYMPDGQGNKKMFASLDKTISNFRATGDFDMCCMKEVAEDFEKRSKR